MPPSHLPAGTAGLAAHVRAAVALPAGPRPAVQPRMAPPAVQPSRPPAPPRLAPPPLARPPAPAKVPAPPLSAPPSRVAQACPDKGGASCGCGGGGGGCGDGKLPAALARRIETLAHGADPLSSQQAFDSALPGLIQEAVAMGVGRPKAQGCSCGGRCGHGAAASVQPAPAPGGPAAVLQRAQCNRGAGAQEWYTKTGAQVRAYFQHNYGMDARTPRPRPAPNGTACAPCGDGCGSSTSRALRAWGTPPP